MTSTPSKLEPAGRRRRLGAALLDWLLYAGAFLLLLALAPLLKRIELPLLGPFFLPFAFRVIALTALVIYQLALVAKTGQSLGKRWLRIEIVRTDGRPPGFIHGVLLRTVVPVLIPVVASVLLAYSSAATLGEIPEPLSGQFYVSGVLGLLDVALVFAPARRCLHDYIAGTRVVVGYDVPVRVRHGRLAVVALMLAPFVVALSAATGFGSLYVQSCAGPRRDCDGLWWTLCEADLTSVESCGACGNVCGDFNASSSCVQGRCVITCEPGFVDCDGATWNGCEAELSSDSEHCGACSVDCKGAPCKEGRCGPRLIGRGNAIAADDAAVYAYRGDIVKYPLDGGAFNMIAPDDEYADPRVIGQFGMAVDAERIYLARKGRISSVPIHGGTIVTVAEPAGFGGALAVVGGMLVWPYRDDGHGVSSLMAMPTSGGKVTPLVSGRSLDGFYLPFGAHASGLAWSTGESVWILPTGSSRPTKLAANRDVATGVTLDESQVYWTESWRALMAVPREGGAPIRLAEVGASAMPLLADKDYVYWAGTDSGPRETIKKVPKKGGDTVVLVTHPQSIRGFAINSTHVFWVDEKHDIYMFPKSPR